MDFGGKLKGFIWKSRLIITGFFFLVSSFFFLFLEPREKRRVAIVVLLITMENNYGYLNLSRRERDSEQIEIYSERRISYMGHSQGPSRIVHGHCTHIVSIMSWRI